MTGLVEIKQIVQAEERESQTWKEELVLLARKALRHLGGVQKFSAFLSSRRVTLFQISGFHSFSIKFLSHKKYGKSVISFYIVILQSTKLNLEFGFQPFCSTIMRNVMVFYKAIIEMLQFSDSGCEC